MSIERDFLNAQIAAGDYAENKELTEAIFSGDLTVEEDGSYDDGAWTNCSTYHLAFSRRDFLSLIDVLGIEVKHGQTIEEAWEAVQETLLSKGQS